MKDKIVGLWILRSPLIWKQIISKFLYSLHACLFIQLLNLSFLTHEYFSFPLFYFLQMLCNKITAPKIKLAAYISSSIDTVCDFSQNGVLPPTNVSTLISYPIVCFFNVINLIIVLYLMICKYFEQCRWETKR